MFKYNRFWHLQPNKLMWYLQFVYSIPCEIYINGNSSNKQLNKITGNITKIVIKAEKHFIAVNGEVTLSCQSVLKNKHTNVSFRTPRDCYVLSPITYFPLKLSRKLLIYWPLNLNVQIFCLQMTLKLASTYWSWCNAYICICMCNWIYWINIDYISNF